MVYSNPASRTFQCTLADEISYVGVGLHSGQKVSMTLLPAPPNNGICFLRKDVASGHGVIRASWRNVVDTRLCTVLGNEHGVTLSTVEHVLAALRASGVDNALIEINAGEVPILDGSCAPLVELIDQARISSQRLPRSAIRIESAIEVRQGERFAVLAPASWPRISVDIEFEHAAIGTQCYSVELHDHIFASEIAPARTFGFASELAELRSQGLALGGSMRNAVLLDDVGVVNRDGLRFADEFARHKILDCLGDLALAELPIFGHLYTYKPGHRLNNALLRELFVRQDAWRRQSYTEIMQDIETREFAQLANSKARSRREDQ
ncbi:MAG: UDP-3-O-acyl-N-acetylglucosamine deacetylase [Gammaproteobacteria bacterium]|jgi:UDP-3-O-[3-hydroxymyristoyl] N-acetylglucosamine deacetylase